MKIDIVFPDNNEEKFIQLAEKLGWDGLCFVYRDKINMGIDELIQKTNLAIFLAGKQGIIRLAKSSEKDQHLLEKNPPDVLYCVEFSTKRDSMHFRNSGLNQVICKLANKNKTVFAVSLSSVIGAKNRPQIIGRVIQNIMLCRKYKVSYAVASFAKNPYEMKSPNDLMSFMISLGMKIPEAKDSVNAVGNKIKEKMSKKSSSYVKEGITLIQ